MGQIDLEKTDGIAVITINSPEVKNGLTPQMGLQLQEVCDEVDDDMSIGAAIVRGADGTFCSGADRRRWVPGRDQSEDAVYKESGAVYGGFRRVGDLRVPTIAAVRGAAVGAGINLLLATDLRIVATNARLISGFLKIGLHPGGGYFTISHRAAGREATAAMGLFQEEINGERAVEIGLAWQAVDDADVDDVALRLAARPAADPELSREATRSFRVETANEAIGWDAGLQFERAIQMWSQRRRNSR
ncbi:enoyl-CoA hydratase/isomerase family protein [Epidermidibacterium keratini]|uniref:Enoyl-CoA hydratase/isomerase family protein n=1 Tax=Epidermidibacterium keratini TaxID=1891644 RepID=A0A7L4YKY3_9ACTN|nr:enoyl-CoA hydratase-related protein [Epidermidibacterium keratini]QHB99910.1 enoyl-CoA hydratase/isomerase family protein [Epidermidibacterium keratini]